jgi:Antibiotic biosynthesis monooxygenase
VLVITRHRVTEAQAREFLQQAGTALEVLQSQTGFQTARVGRALDDGALWMVSTEWSDVGSYRRALSVYDVRVHAVPLLGTALDEPSAYEILEERHGESVTSAPTRRAADADQVGLGEAAMPAVPTDLD